MRIEGYSRMLRTGEAPPLRVEAESAVDNTIQTDLECDPGLLARHDRLDIAPDSSSRIEQDMVLPTLDSPRRTRTFRLSALARSAEAEASGIDMKWLAVAPVVVPDEADGSAEPTGVTWHAFGVDSLVKGDWSWQGESDLSARFAVVLSPEDLTFIVEVTDNNLDVASLGKHISEGDSVEVCLDLRPAADQAKPVYSPEVVLLMVKPGTVTREQAEWEPLDDLTPRLAGVTAESTLTRNGYAVRMSIPRRSLQRDGDEGLTGIGFDVHVNDSDFRMGRERQMVWAGTADNFVNPSGFAALADPGEDALRWRVSLR